MKLVNDFLEYQILDLNKGKKLESWNGIILNRPDPQVIWEKEEIEDWKRAQAIYDRSNTGGGKWNIKKSIPASWIITYQDLKFNLKDYKTILVPYETVNDKGLLKCIKANKIDIEGVGIKKKFLVGIMDDKISIDGVNCILNYRLLEE